MIWLKLGFMLCSFFMTVQSRDQQLLMFVHTQSQECGDEEGLNVAYQALTAIMQHAAPVLISENIWQHVVLRKDRFKKRLENEASFQNAVFQMHQEVNKLLKNNKGSIAIINAALNDSWYQRNYSHLQELDQHEYKHLLFDYFCYYVFDYLSDWSVYQLSGGYLLWLAHNNRHGFDIKNAYFKTKAEIAKPIFLNRSVDLDLVLQKYMKKNKTIAWSFFLTGHGYHQDNEYAQSGVAGLTLQSLKKLLNYFNKECTTKLCMYSSCFGAGQHTIIPYLDDNGKELLLSYPVILVSLTDAPAYVFGVPSGLKLPPYNEHNMLTAVDADRYGLKPYFLQQFATFCEYAKREKIGADIAKSINPYVQCSFNNCTILKIENMPLIRRAGNSYFIPLDEFGIYCVTASKDQPIDLENKTACLWYVNKFHGTITASQNLPAFVSMIPGNQVHYINKLNVQGFDFSHIVRSLFLSIDDIQEQNIYFLDKLCCSVMIPEISSTIIHELERVLILPSGPWLPSFSQEGASCYVFIQHAGSSYCICFDQNKRISQVQKLQEEELEILKRFELLLRTESCFEDDQSMQTLLSSKYFAQKNKQQQDLLVQCLHEKICK